MTLDDLHLEPTSYDDSLRAWLGKRHYLGYAPPSCLFAVAVRRAVPGLFGESIGDGPVLGLCLVGRPTARKLPQDGSVGEVTRLFLERGLPHGAASMVLRYVADVARCRRDPPMRELIAYHDRTKHAGCVYKKAGFKKDGVSRHQGRGWGSRGGRRAADVEITPKRRWRLVLRVAPESKKVLDRPEPPVPTEHPQST